jgi:fatty acid kinase fatty acid binding subunit
VKLTGANTAIVLDSTCDYPQAPEEHVNWRVVPLYVRFGDETFRDYDELGPDRFFPRLESEAELPRTAAPAPGDFAAVYADLAGRFDRIYSLHLPAKLSGTLGSAAAAAADFPVVRVVDSGAVSAAIAMLGFAIQRRLDRGTTDDEIDELVLRFRSECDLLFTLDTLDYLARGGRIGRAAALAGALLAVKPILMLRDGEVVPLKRVRGTKHALVEFGRLLEAGSRDEPSLRIGLAHAAAPERLRRLEAIVRTARPRAQVELSTPIGPVLGTHAGPGAVGLFWFDDPVV